MKVGDIVTYKGNRVKVRRVATDRDFAVVIYIHDDGSLNGLPFGVKLSKLVAT